jgi:urease accessory protein
MLPRATRVRDNGTPVDRVTLTHEDRHRRRARLTTDQGLVLLLDLPKARRLTPGSRLELEDGRLVEVRAAEEDILDVEAKDSVQLARLAWHLGNRHTPVEVLRSGRLRLRYDHVLAAMLEGLGATLHRGKAPFTPEYGAYAHDP